MQTVDFLTLIRNEGFSDPVEVIREADGALDVHQHPFEAKALILEGEIEIGLGPTGRVFFAGDVFHLQENEPHWERYGPNGVRYLSARRIARLTSAES